MPDTWSADFESDPLGAFTLTDSNPSLENTDLDAGTYTVTESEVTDTELASIDCGDATATVDLANRTVSVDLAAGDVVSCTFTNEYQAVEVLPAEEEAPAASGLGRDRHPDAAPHG